MEAKLKAIELVNRFKPFAHGYVGSEAIAENAKECALITVDEILADYEIFNKKNKSFKVPSFWQMVKEEIIKL
jgi:formate dehydrogenase assembly factor FdhD